MIGALLTDEPALITGLVSAVLILLATFGIPITDDQRTAVLGLFSAAIALAGALVVRSRVTPTAHVDALVKAVAADHIDPPTALP